MKKIIVILTALTLFTSCGSSGDDDSSANEENNDPAVLSLPLNNSECITGFDLTTTKSKVTFNWNTAKGNQTYYLYIKNLSTQNTLQFNAAGNKSFETTLDKGTPYSWYVTSKKTNGSYVQSETWKFYNSGPGISNYAPFPAELVIPAMSSTVQGSTVTLEWIGSDVDGDIENYKVFFGTATSPTVLIGTTKEKSLISTAVVKDTVYYWKVITFDRAGNSTASPVFQFKTS